MRNNEAKSLISVFLFHRAYVLVYFWILVYLEILPRRGRLDRLITVTVGCVCDAVTVIGDCCVVWTALRRVVIFR